MRILVLVMFLCVFSMGQTTAIWNNGEPVDLDDSNMDSTNEYDMAKELYDALDTLYQYTDEPIFWFELAHLSDCEILRRQADYEEQKERDYKAVEKILLKYHNEFYR